MNYTCITLCTLLFSTAMTTVMPSKAGCTNDDCSSVRRRVSTVLTEHVDVSQLRLNGRVSSDVVEWTVDVAVVAGSRCCVERELRHVISQQLELPAHQFICCTSSHHQLTEIQRRRLATRRLRWRLYAAVELYHVTLGNVDGARLQICDDDHITWLPTEKLVQLATASLIIITSVCVLELPRIIRLQPHEESVSLTTYPSFRTIQRKDL